MSVGAPSIEQAAKLWGWLLTSGIALVILGFLAFSLRADTISVLGIFAGIAFIFVGFNFIFASSATEGGWRWFFIIGGVVAIVAGIVAFAHPENTVVAMAMLVGWFLLIAGILDIVRALMNTHRHLWWLGLITGLIEVALGAWAVNDVTNSVVLLVTIIGVYCIVKGIAEIFLAFQLRAVKHELEGRHA
jgi:uncharacterized membrane protein HdeD (DUF308 family)